MEKKQKLKTQAKKAEEKQKKFQQISSIKLSQFPRK